MTTSITDYLPSNITTTSTDTAVRGDRDLGQEDFLELMIAQLQNQDPTNPSDSAEFLSQIAQFSTVEGVSDLSKSFDEFTSLFAGSQTMDAINLVGRSVMTDTNVGYMNDSSGMTATLDLSGNAASATAYIQDEYGALVNQISLGPLADGYQELSWDGTDFNGDPVDPGRYRISAEAFIDGQTQAVSVYAHNQVDSVVLSDNGTSYQLRLEDGSSAELSDVKGIFQ